MWLLFAAPKSRRDKWIVWGGIVLLILSVLFSMLFEDLLPLAKRTSVANAARVALGMTGFVIAVILLIYGGKLLIRGSLNAMVQSKTDQFPGWFASWWPGLLWTIGSIVLFFVSSLVYNGVWLR